MSEETASFLPPNAVLALGMDKKASLLSQHFGWSWDLDLMCCFSSVGATLCAWVRHLAHRGVFIGLGAMQHFSLSWTVRSIWIFYLPL